jgi:DNA-binding CsgD family transcriptional regulator
MSARIAEFVEASNAAGSVDELMTLYADAIGSYGYDRFMYAMMTEDPIHGWHRVPSIARSYPEDWMAFYVEKGYMSVDPLRRLAFQARRPFLWDDVPKLMSLTPEQEICLNQCVDAGMNNGIGVPFHGPYGEVAGVGLASSEKNIDLNPGIVATLGLISNQLHVAHIGLALGDMANPPVNLTAREQEVLLWCARGKSNWAISKILKVSEHCVKFHVANCIAKLGAESRIGAVLKAIRLGLIAP